MPRMKTFLRKLHIGSSTSPPPVTASVTGTGTGTETFDRVTSDSSGSPTASVVRVSGSGVGEEENYDYLEEEFQVQLALAISASDNESRVDPESDEIRAAKELSLVWSPSGASVDYLSLRYWNNNVIDYGEKLMDGFYDVYGITSNASMHGKMPLLADLQVSTDAGYEVILVDSTIDPTLRELEIRAEYISADCGAAEVGIRTNSLIEKIADLVSEIMGGPVNDADQWVIRWTVRYEELRSSLKTAVLPLGCLNLGLSRHRALLFKVLADRINLPCRLVKGCYYTGTDGGAVCFIKIDRHSEYIVDLMGAPGLLIPAEQPIYHPHIFGLAGTSSLIKDSCLPLDIINDAIIHLPKEYGSGSNGTSSGEIPVQGINLHSLQRNQTEKFEDDFDKLLPSLRRSNASSSGTSAKSSPAQKMQVKDVSKCVISAAQNPDFAQKLHAVLVESNASVSPRDLGENKSDDSCFEDGTAIAAFDRSISNSKDKSSPGNSDSPYERKVDVVNKAYSPQRLLSNPWNCAMQNSGVENYVASSSEAEGILCAHSDRVNPVMDGVAEWEIPWEDIHIGERVGIGSYGEVYHADWNGNEVAVKKFLDQEFSGDALEQLKCEVSIMQRMRHPNVVLFMGAVTLPPNLSILTEYLPRGSLCKILHRPKVQIDERRRLKMALDVVKGMNYLHTSNPTIVHRDLKSPNLLVDRNWNVKVCDFGLSRLKHHTMLSTVSMAGTAEWMAPEVLRNEPSNEKCDVFSFGVVLWELATLKMPWTGINSMQVVGAVGFQNRRLEISEKIDPNVAKIISDCWESDPNLRPSFLQLLHSLKRLQRLNV